MMAPVPTPDVPTMRTRLRILSALCLLAASSGSCTAGPHQLRRSVDDWDQSLYVNSPWLNATFWILPVLPIGYLGAILGDFLVTDAYSFWLDDAWDGAGTAFEHAHVQATDGRVESLLLDRSGWTRLEKTEQK